MWSSSTLGIQSESFYAPGTHPVQSRTLRAFSSRSPARAPATESNTRSAYGEQPWLGDAFSSFTSDPARLPVDVHEMVAMVAPRGLFVMENPHINHLAARSGSVAALGGAEVYKALGAGSNISYWSDVQSGSHCSVRPEWKVPLQRSLQAFLLKNGTPPGVFRISSVKPGNLASWRDWTTPTLTTGR